MLFFPGKIMNKFRIQFIAILIVQLLFPLNIVHAQDQSEVPVSIPSEVGKIETVYLSSTPSNKWVIEVQDAHCVVQAQKNISRLIEYLSEQYGLKYVYLEGGQGPLDTSGIAHFSDGITKRQVLEKYLNQGLISGAEYTAVLNEQQAFYFGIEDQKLYDQNRIMLLEAEKSRPQRERILSSIHQQLELAYKDAIEKKKDVSLLLESLGKINLLLKASRLDIELKELEQFKSMVQDLTRDTERFFDLLGVSYQSKDWVDIAKLFEPVIKFYEIVVQRDYSMGMNVLKKIEDQQPEISVLIIGGFHSEGIGHILSKKGINAIVVSPKINDWTGRENYVAVMKKTLLIKPPQVKNA